MAGLAIPPHSRRLSRLAVLALVLLSGAAFAAGVGRQLQPAGPSPFPRTTLASDQARLPGDPPDATPAPSLQVAEAAAPRHRAPAASESDADASAPLLDVAAAPTSPAAAAGAAGAAGADAAANAPDQPPPAADPAPPAPDPALPPT
jgi:hypothetical protein